MMESDAVRVPTAPGLRGCAPEPAAQSQPEALVPSRWIGPKYSPNLKAWIAKATRRGLGEQKVYRVADGQRYVGQLDEEGWLYGSRLMSILNHGARAEVYAYQPAFVTAADEQPAFWAEYDRIGRCAIDVEHRMPFIGSGSRWAVNGDTRSCLWCGCVTQKLQRWTETVERKVWRPA